jgi:hypothetical protein
MTYRPTSLTARLAQIDAQADAWEAEGYCVGRLVTCEDFWNERGYHTAADLDRMFDEEEAKERRKAAYCGDDWDESEEERAERLRAERRERIQWEAQQAEHVALTADAARHAVYNHYQPGWA